ncbi:MAG: hypothetical protein M3Z01_03070 [Thermoproteota archaeon]|nr:hypothetical protein [Thermoproteota archaeon]
MAYSFDILVFSSTLIMFIAALICIFAYEFVSPKPLFPPTKEPKIADNLNKKGRKYRQQQQTDKFGK